MRWNNNKGFSMVELLAVVVILGILSAISIVSIQGIIAKARVKYYTSQEENIVMAGRSFDEANKQYLPKVSGQVSTIPLVTLREAKYIDEVVDYHKNSCHMEKSYVQIFKYQDEYMYSTYLECPDYHNDLNSFGAVNLTIAYSGKNYKDAQANLSIKEGENKYGIVYYAYTVYVDGVEVHSEKFEQKKYRTPITTTVSLKEYVPGTVKITLTAVNAYGISNTISKSTDKYVDSDGPDCVIADGDDPKGSGANREWVASREITIGCKDEGVGCVRDNYTKIFISDVKNGKIKIEDKKGNVTTCSVAAHVDITAPKVTLNVYKRGDDGKKTGSVLYTKVVDPKDYTDKSNISATLDINSSVLTDTVNDWLNKEKYPNGIYIEAAYEDISYLTGFDWKTNIAGIDSKSSSNYRNVSDRTENSVTSPKKDTQKATIGFSLYEEGYRYGTLVLTDVVGHKTTVTITAQIDRTAPTKPTVTYYKWNNNSEPTSTSGLDAYTPNTWTNKNVYIVASGSTDTMSGFDVYKYTITKSGRTTTGTGSTYSIKDEGEVSVQYKACDKAGNCSSNTTAKTIQIDKLPPTINVVAYKRTSSGSYTGSSIGSVSTTTSNTTKTLSSYSNTTNGWLNDDEYPYGIYYKVTVEDTVGVSDLTWEYNESGLKETDRSVNNLTGSSSTTVSGTSVSKNYYLSAEGYRIGKFTLTDRAGNTAVVNIVAPIDRTAPTVPTVTLYKWANNNTQPTTTSGLDTYRVGLISNKKVWVYPSNSTDSMSGFDVYKYTTTGAAGNKTNKTGATYSVVDDGETDVRYKACDKAGNCSSNTNPYNILVDITPPKIEVIAYKNSNYSSQVASVSTTSSTTLNSYSGSYSGWLNNSSFGNGIYYKIKVSDSWMLSDLEIRYNDAGITSGSGLNNLKNLRRDSLTGDSSNTSYFSFTDDGYRKATLTLTDLAGNTSVVNIEAKLDRGAPSCSKSGEPSRNDWAGNRAINVQCTDSISGCQSSPGRKEFYGTTVATTSYNLTDNAGNTGTCNVNVYVDATPPTCGSVSGDSTTWTNSNRTVSVGCSDSGSGCARSSTSRTFDYTTQRDFIKIYDNLGNSTDCYVNAYVDKTAPYTPYYTITSVGANTTITNDQTNIGEYNTTDRWISYTINKPQNAFYSLTGSTAAHDDHSGVRYYLEKYWCEDGWDTPGYTYTEIRSWRKNYATEVQQLTSRNGATYCRHFIKAVDRAGNEGPELEIREYINRY